MLRLTAVYLFFLAVSAISPPKKLSKIKAAAPRIINGEQASLGQFPWQALLYISGEEYWFCGGSIINEVWILTSAHCLEGAIDALVFTGAVDVLQGDVNAPVEFILHEDFDAKTFENDIALIKVFLPLDFDENTTPIALAVEPLDADVEITVSGYGATSGASDAISLVLRYTQLVSISNDECNGIYGVILDEMVCATSYTDVIKSTCSGDTGSPAVVNADSDPVLVGVTSFVSNEGCESGAPSGFTRVAYYRSWIQEHTGI